LGAFPVWRWDESLELDDLAPWVWATFGISMEAMFFINLGSMGLRTMNIR
jgi:hypothetical protein